eukprot:CAMPEP_0178383804 /NCGR_PEP_ID=MMETSP0689_2-20121128/7189_1 /TAXON_ID=160604 /ORGANISM="Amphidinium massartii, Strain CS-259" /LENGTH=54 /DNA_ID=CAMNT_0020004033 /DNA_START=85 /DNA_END=249 /DNA_ORIENTATION=-
MNVKYGTDSTCPAVASSGFSSTSTLSTRSFLGYLWLRSCTHGDTSLQGAHQEAV